VFIALPGYLTKPPRIPEPIEKRLQEVISKHHQVRKDAQKEVVQPHQGSTQGTRYVSNIKGFGFGTSRKMPGSSNE
jgi:hypothetical protein